MKKAAIGVLGGSFNPPHEGHRALVQHALKRLSLARLRVLVTPQNPLKNAGDYAPLEQRVAATMAMMHGLPRVRVGPEAERGPVFAIDTISRVLQREPGRPVVYIIGADSFAGLHRWHRWREFMQLLPVAVFSRPGYRMQALTSEAARAFHAYRVREEAAPTLAHRTAPAWCYIGGLGQPESSTAIRERRTPSSSHNKSATSKRLPLWGAPDGEIG